MSDRPRQSREPASVREAYDKRAAAELATHKAAWERRMRRRMDRRASHLGGER